MRSLFILVMLMLTLSSCSDNMVYFKPLIYTDEPQDVFANSVKLGGEVLSEGGMDVSEYGIVYSTNYPPTINDDKIVIGNRGGRFSNVFSSFLAGTTYYYTAFGTNSEGTGYGQVYEFTTMAEAPCTPNENYLDVATSLSGLSSGYYLNTEISTNEYGEYGADYELQARKGFFSTHTEINVYFDGDVEELQSGVYPTVSDLDFAFQIPNKAVVVLKFGQYSFILEDEVVYIERVGNDIIITLCNVEFKKNITTTLEVTALINTKYTVSIN